MKSWEKKDVFAHLSQTTMNAQEKTLPFKYAREYRQALIDRGITVGKFHNAYDEMRFYLCIQEMEDRNAKLSVLHESLKNELAQKEKELAEAEETIEALKKNVEELTATIESTSHKSKDVDAAIDNVKSMLHDMEVKEAEEAAARKERRENSRRNIRSLEERIDAKQAELQKLLEQLELDAARNASVEFADENSADTLNASSFDTDVCIGDTMPIYSDNCVESATEEVCSEVSESSESSMPVTDLESSDSAVAEVNPAVRNEKYGAVIDALENLQNLNCEVAADSVVHNPEDLARIKELEEKDLQNQASAEFAQQRIDRLEKEVEELRTQKQVDADLEEELRCDQEYRTKKGPATSSIPSRARGYGCEETRPPLDVTGSTGAKDTPPGNTSGEVSAGSSHSGNPDADADYNALHDSQKSPNVKPGKKKPGKPKGSHGGGMKLNQNAHQLPLQYCDPTECKACYNYETCQKERMRSTGTRHIEDAVIQIVRQTYVQRKCICPKDGKELIGQFPEELSGKGSKQYGKVIRSLAVLLNAYGFVSYERTATIINGFFGTSLSQTIINDWVKEAATRLKPVVSYIGEAMLQEAVAYLDETGVTVDGVLCWLHTFCDANYTYLHADPKRGRDGMDRGGLLPFFKGTIVTDCWASYFSLPNIKHGLCNAHLLRELYALVKFYQKDAEWAGKLMELLREMDHARNLKKAKHLSCFTVDELKEFYRRFDEIIHMGLDLHNLSHEPVDRTKKKKKSSEKASKENEDTQEVSEDKQGRTSLGKAANLLLRLRDYKDKYLLFLERFDVEFSNGNAERSFRMVSKKRAIVGGFKTPQGASDWATIWSYVDTCRKHKIDPATAIKECFSGNSVNLLFTKDDQDALDLARVNRLADPDNKEKIVALETLNKEVEEYYDKFEDYKAKKKEQKAKRKEKQKEKQKNTSEVKSDQHSEAPLEKAS